METIATIVSYASGFALMRTHKAPIDLVATSLIVDAALAPLTAVIAARRGRSPLRWVVAGFVLGMWALAYVLIVAPAATDDPARPQSPSRPPTSDAAA
jgi:type IV secretory pathway TrbD component